VQHSVETTYSKTALIRINWDGQPLGYAENPENFILKKNGYIGSLKW
jgi:hypothetical protein